MSGNNNRVLPVADTIYPNTCQVVNYYYVAYDGGKIYGDTYFFENKDKEKIINALIKAKSGIKEEPDLKGKAEKATHNKA